MPKEASNYSIGRNKFQCKLLKLLREWVFFLTMIGLSKERPILDHHAKAHIYEIRQISGEIQWISYEFQVKSGRFCMDFRWNPPDFVRISKGQLPGMVSPMFYYSVQNIVNNNTKEHHTKKHCNRHSTISHRKTFNRTPQYLTELLEIFLCIALPFTSKTCMGV